MNPPLLTPILPRLEALTTDVARHRMVGRVLAADPALAGRVAVDESGSVILSGPAGGPPPASFKERRRWELHTRLRLVTELGEGVANRVTVSWANGDAYD